jgi:hypothetical protein
VDDKQFLMEQDVLLDAYRLGVQIFNAGFRPTFIVGLWRGGSTVGIAVQECLQALDIETDHISIRTSYSGVSNYQEMIDNPAQNRTGRKPDFFVHTTDKWLVLPYELCGPTEDELADHKAFMQSLPVKKPPQAL